jgi:hypothetical protein
MKVEVKVLFRRIFVNVSSITLIIPGLELELEFFHELLSRLKVKVFCRLISFEWMREKYVIFQKESESKSILYIPNWGCVYF